MTFLTTVQDQTLLTSSRVSCSWRTITGEYLLSYTQKIKGILLVNANTVKQGYNAWKYYLELYLKYEIRSCVCCKK